MRATETDSLLRWMLRNDVPLTLEQYVRHSWARDVPDDERDGEFWLQVPEPLWPEWDPDGEE